MNALPPKMPGGQSPRALAEALRINAKRAAESARLRSGDVLRPVVDAIAEAPAIIVDIVEGTAKQTAAVIGAEADRVAEAVSDARADVEELARERRAQVAAARTEIEASRSSIIAEIARTINAGLDQAVTADRRRRSLLGFGVASMCALAIGCSGFLLGGWVARTELHEPATVALEQFRQTATEAQEAIAEVKRSADAAGPGLEAVRDLANLPAEQQSVFRQMASEMVAAGRGKGPSPELQAVHQMMRLPPQQRAEAAHYATLPPEARAKLGSVTGLSG